MLVVVARACSCGIQQSFWQNDARAETRSVGMVGAFSDAVEAVAGGYDPRIGRRPLEIFAVIFEHRRRLRRNGGKVVESFVDAGSEAGGGYVVAEDSAVDHLREE